MTSAELLRLSPKVRFVTVVLLFRVTDTLTSLDSQQSDKEAEESLLQTKLCSNALQGEKHGLLLAGGEVFEGDEICQWGLYL
jgi:hypothetical protein